MSVVRGFDANVSVATAERKKQEFVTESLHSKTFGVWINKQLTKKNIQPIQDVCVDFKNGVKLIQLLEVIYNEPVGQKYNPNPTTEIAKVENVAIAIEFMKKHKCNINLNSKDITDGNRKLTLGLMWRLIMGHTMLDPSQNTDEISSIQRNKAAKANLLAFCQKQVERYGITVTDLCNSWYDGRAFCALAHSLEPSFDWNTVSTNTTYNLNTAFSAAEKLGIPRMLQVEDMTAADINSRPDEKCIMTYLSEFPLVFIERMEQMRSAAATTTLPLPPPPVVIDQSAELERQRLEMERQRQEILQKQELEKQALEAQMRKQYDEQARFLEQQILQQQQQREAQAQQQLNDIKAYNAKLMEEQEQLMKQSQFFLQQQQELASKAQQQNSQADVIVQDNMRLKEEIERLRNDNALLNQELLATNNKLIGRLHVVVKEARNLRGMDLGGRSDPYVKLKLEQQEYKTKTIKRTVNPRWEQEFEFFVTDRRSELSLSIFDWDRFTKDDFIGRALIKVSELKEGDQIRWYGLQPLTNEKVSGDILVSLNFKSGK